MILETLAENSPSIPCHIGGTLSNSPELHTILIDRASAERDPATCAVQPERRPLGQESCEADVEIACDQGGERNGLIGT